MIGDFISGAGYFLRGIRMIARPELRKFVIIPLLINITVFTAGIWLGIYQFDSLMDWLLPHGAGWLAEAIRGLLWLFFSIAVLLIMFFTFTLVANILGSPFNGLLSEKVEHYLIGKANEDSGGFQNFISSILPSIFSEIKKLLYFLLTAILLFLLILIPGINILSPFLWSVFASWMLALEYIAYPMENHGFLFAATKKELKKFRMLSFGFGITVMFASAVPVLNFIVMPAAVTGATVLWAERMKG